MEGARGRVLRNVALRGMAELGAKASTLALFMVMGRKLGDQGVGVYSFALSTAALATMFADFGQDQVLTREVARDHAALPRYYADTMAVRTLVGLPLLAAAVVVVPLFGYGGQAQLSLLLVGAGVLVDMLAKTTMAVFQAYERIGYLSSVLVTERWLLSVGGVVAMVMGAGVVAVSAVFLAAAVVALVLATILLRRVVTVPIRVSPGTWAGLMRTCAPFGLAGFFGAILFRVDATMLAAFTDASTVGNYAVAYRLFETTLFVSWSINTAFYPVFARSGPGEERDAATAFEHALKLGLSAVLPVAIGFAVLAHPLIRTVFGSGPHSDFGRAPQAVRLLAPAVCFYPVSFLADYLILSRKADRKLTALYAAVAVENIVANLILIPRYSLHGAAASTSVSEGLSALGTILIARRLVGPLDWRRVLAGPVGAALPATAVLLALRGLVNPLAAAVAAGLVYAVVLLAIERARHPDDLAALRDMVRRRG
ncbi:MAG: hypothetical protein QOK43_2312 [Acidimicrobiaceae bacterium]|nr:hypothetical protein [Acidimicrobiaceae bacterium]